MSTVIIADLCTPEGEELLMSWLQMPNVVGIFLVPPCGSASRARQIPLSLVAGAGVLGRVHFAIIVFLMEFLA